MQSRKEKIKPKPRPVAIRGTLLNVHQDQQRTDSTNLPAGERQRVGFLIILSIVGC